MKTILLIAAGGAIGSVCRYLAGRASLAGFGPDFPWGTLLVNITGSLLIGVIAGLLSAYANWSESVRYFLVVGFLGGFTTFSAFALDSFTLYERGAYVSAAIYVFVSIAGSFLALAAGLIAVKSLTA